MSAPPLHQRLKSSPLPITKSSAGLRKLARSAPTSPQRRDSKQVWFTLKDTGKTQVFDGQPPFALLKTLDTGPISNHVNIVRNANGMFAYVTVGGLNEIKVFRTDNFAQVATIPVGKLPHGVWPSGDGTRVYVGLENDDKVAAIDTLKNEVIATSPIGQAPQALVYVPDAVPAASGAINSAMTRMMVVPEGLGTSNLQPLGVAGQSAQLWLAPPGAKKEKKAPPRVSLSDQGLVQVLQAAVTGLEPGKPYLLALATEPSGTGVLEPLQGLSRLAVAPTFPRALHLPGHTLTALSTAAHSTRSG